MTPRCRIWVITLDGSARVVIETTSSPARRGRLPSRRPVFRIDDNCDGAVMTLPSVDSEEERRILARLDEAVREAKTIQQSVRLDGAVGFSCYLDTDGFRDRVHRDPKKLYEIYRALRRDALASGWGITAYGANRVTTSYHDKLVWPYTFSDSWFFASVDDSEDSFRQISHVASVLWMRLLEVGLPGRGGIARGAAWWHPEEQIVLGPGLSDAYALAESLDCFGVAISPTIDCSAWASACTEALDVPIRGGDRMIRRKASLRFARLGASRKTGSWRGDRWTRIFDEMAAAYALEPDARDHVKHRYDASRPIVASMLRSAAPPGSALL